MPNNGKPKSLRDRMPAVAARIDGLRAQFGAESFDARLRRAMRGEPVFYAREGGVEFGTPSAELNRWANNMEEAFGPELVLIGTTIEHGLPSLLPVTTDPCLLDGRLENRRLCAGCDGGCIGKSRRCSEEMHVRSARRPKPAATELWAAPEIVQPVDLVDDSTRPDEQEVMEYLGR